MIPYYIKPSIPTHPQPLLTTFPIFILSYPIPYPPFSLLPSPFSLLPSPFSLLPSPFSLLPSPFSLLPSPFSPSPAFSPQKTNLAKTPTSPKPQPPHPPHHIHRSLTPSIIPRPPPLLAYYVLISIDVFGQGSELLK